MHSFISPSLSYCFFQCYGDHRHLHSFPTRRSSDLAEAIAVARVAYKSWYDSLVSLWRQFNTVPVRFAESLEGALAIDAAIRSEEHTSELQSLTNLVCRLLLEKKKKNKTVRSHYNLP